MECRGSRFALELCRCWVPCQYYTKRTQITLFWRLTHQSHMSYSLLTSSW